MVKYQRLLLIEREEINRQLASGFSIREIANCLNRTPSTISREVNSNVVHRKYYRAIFAQQRSNKMRHKLKSRKLDTDIPLRKVVFSYLSKKWSPEQIAKRLIMLYPNNMDMCISHESIYSYLYVLPRGELKHQITSSLRRHHKYRQKKNKNRKKPSVIQNFLSIEERPAEVKDRILPGTLGRRPDNRAPQCFCHRNSG